jgi:hypothetical protein
MPILNYAALVNNKTSFTPGQDTKIFISPAFNRGQSAPQFISVLDASNNTTPNGTGATVTPVIVNGVIVDLIITNGGSNYYWGATVTFSGTSGSGASAVLYDGAYPFDGVLTAYIDLIGGSNYSSDTVATVVGRSTGTNSVHIGDELVLIDDPNPAPLYEGTRIILPNVGALYVAQYLPTGSYSTPIVPSLYNAPNGTPAIIDAWIPVLSVNQVNLDQKADVIKELNFSMGFFYQKAVTGLDATSTAQGTQVYGDPGLEVLINANLNGQLVHVNVLKGSQRGGASFDAVVAGIPESVQRNGFFQQTINLEPVGTVTKFDY